MSRDEGLIEPHNVLTNIEIQRACLCLRLCRLHVEQRRVEMRENRLLRDEHFDYAIRHLDNDMYLITSALRKLEAMVK